LTDYLTEQEQIQQLKNWIKQYGMTILLGILIAFAITSGWRYWQSYHLKVSQHASAVYDEMIAMRAQNNTTGTITQAKKLLRNYTKTPYADIAAFLLAREAVITKDYAEATQQLNWVVEHSQNPSMRDIARIRAARILIAEKKPDEALSLLTKVQNESFKGLADEVRGDALLAKKDVNAARKSYELALQGLPNAEVSRPILEMKFNNLAT
jgi:predicted negative regulator of RcsB-dependent stress response